MEREEIWRGVVSGLFLRTITIQLGRTPSTISRESNRNDGLKRYRASQADQEAWNRNLRPQACRLATHPALRRIVAKILRCNWSPEQIVSWLKREHPGDERKYASHETIYKSLFIQTRGVLKKELQHYLRIHRAIRRSRHASLKWDGTCQIKNMISIREQPASVEDPAVPGH